MFTVEPQNWAFHFEKKVTHVRFILESWRKYVVKCEVQNANFYWLINWFHHEENQILFLTYKIPASSSLWCASGCFVTKVFHTSDPWEEDDKGALRTTDTGALVSDQYKILWKTHACRHTEHWSAGEVGWCSCSLAKEKKSKKKKKIGISCVYYKSSPSAMTGLVCS